MASTKKPKAIIDTELEEQISSTTETEVKSTTVSKTESLKIAKNHIKNIEIVDWKNLLIAYRNISEDIGAYTRMVANGDSQKNREWLKSFFIANGLA